MKITSQRNLILTWKNHVHFGVAEVVYTEFLGSIGFSPQCPTMGNILQLQQYAINQNQNKISQSIRIQKHFSLAIEAKSYVFLTLRFFFISQFTIFSLYSGSYLLNLTSLHHIQQKRSSCKQQEDSHFSGRFFQQQSLVHFFQSKHRKPQQLLLLW